MMELIVTKRKSFYPKILRNIYISTNDKNKNIKYRCILVDLSDGGISLKIEKPTVERIILDGYFQFSIGQTAFMRTFLLGYDGPPFEVEGEIRWARKEKDGSYFLGFQFFKVKKQAERLLDAALKDS
ncbi:MAG: PilZ domain-containing protein [Nitrospinae bacterium]|nr:PilZ domain-containing protein [Nitrospinota bacterium]MBI3812864.1 PilZ domain-containing protein [Nitrospinota bacterium]